MKQIIAIIIAAALIAPIALAHSGEAEEGFGCPMHEYLEEGYTHEEVFETMHGENSQSMHGWMGSYTQPGFFGKMMGWMFG